MKPLGADVLSPHLRALCGVTRARTGTTSAGRCAAHRRSRRTGMILSLRRWEPRHLVASWAAYWTALVLVTLGPAAQYIWRATRSDGHGSIAAGFDNHAMNFTVVIEGTTVWSAHPTLATVALWIAGPPLLLWVAWLVSRPRRVPTISSPEADAALPTGGTRVRQAGDASRAERIPAAPDRRTL